GCFSTRSFAERWDGEHALMRRIGVGARRPTSSISITARFLRAKLTFHGRSQNGARKECRQTPSARNYVYRRRRSGGTRVDSRSNSLRIEQNPARLFSPLFRRNFAANSIKAR